MLRKSHSSEWHAHLLNDKVSESAVHSFALQQHLEELKSELNDFGSIFAEWVNSRRVALTADKEAYLKTLAEEQELVEALKKQLAGLVTKRQSIVAQLQAEQREYDESSQYNRELEEQRVQLTRRLSEVKEQVAKLRESLAAEEQVLAAKQELARQQSMREVMTLTLSQEKLGLYVESIEDNVAKFSFKYINAADWERRYSITIDVSTNRYRVRTCEPMIPHLSLLVDQLNENSDFYGFLRRVRSSFVDLGKQ